MIDFTNTVTIERPLTQVYDYLADLRHVPEWNWAIESTEQLTPGAISVGTAYRQIRHAPSRSVEHLRIIALNKNELIVITGTLGPFTAIITYALQPEGTSTRIANRIQLEPAGPAARIAAPVVARAIARSVSDNLATLRKKLEAA